MVSHVLTTVIHLRYYVLINSELGILKPITSNMIYLIWDKDIDETRRVIAKEQMCANRTFVSQSGEWSFGVALISSVA